MTTTRKVRLVHPLSDGLVLSPCISTAQRNDVRLPWSSANCFSILNLLDPDECLKLIAETKRLGYETVGSEYPKEYRSNTRVLVRSEKLAAAIYSRILPFLSWSDIENAHPYGFANKGVWKPIGLNDVFKFSCYGAKQYFLPHFDGCFVVSNEVRSIFTLLIYLNDSYTGGSTIFAKRNKTSKDSNKSITPKAGMGLVFNHDVLHSSDSMKEGIKYVVKTEILFRRCDWSSFPSQLEAYKDDPEYHEASRLYALSDELEKKGDVASATAVYLQALDMQAKHKTYPKRPETDSPSLSAEMFSTVFEYVDLKTIVTTSRVNRQWFESVHDGLIWFRLFKGHFPLLFYGEYSNFHRNQGEKNAFLKDWYTVFKTCYLQEHSKCPALCIDIGSCNTKYGLTGREIHTETTSVGLETYSHYLIVGGGMADCWKAGQAIDMGGDLDPQFRPFTRGRVVDWDAMWVLVNHIYRGNYTCMLTNTQRFNTRAHPVLIAEPIIPFDREKLYHLMFDLLEVPALCIVDSALLAMLAIDKSTGVVIDCGKEGIVCTPVWQGEIMRENRKTYSIAGRVLTEYVSSLQTHPIIHRKYHTVAEMCVVAAGPKESELIKDKYNRQGPEVLFNSHILENVPEDAKETTSVVDFVYSTVMACEESKQDELFNCLLLCGGLTEMQGFIPRFEREMKLKRKETNMQHTSTPGITVIDGAYRLSASSSFSSRCFYRNDYLATKPKISLENENITAPMESKVVSSLIAKFSKKLPMFNV